MDWLERLKPPYLEAALDRLGLTEEDRAELRETWLETLRNEKQLLKLSFLFDTVFNKGIVYEDLDGREAAVLALLQVPVMELSAQELGIPEKVLNDSLSDVGRWMAKERRVSGRFGLTEMGWVRYTLNLELIQLGSLHFMQTCSPIPCHGFMGMDGPVLLAEDGVRYRADGWGAEAEGLPPAGIFTARFEEKKSFVTGHPLDSAGRCSPYPVTLPKARFRRFYKPGDPITEVHIPEGTDLSPTAVRDSFRMAIEYDRPPFRYPAEVFTCHSWMLSPMMDELVPGSRLAAFSDLWHRVALEKAGAGQFYERAFDFRTFDRETAPRDTALRRAILDTRSVLLDSAGLVLASEFSEERSPK